MAFSATPLRKIDYPIDNYVINGDMYFSQRGSYTSATSTNPAGNVQNASGYFVDRWKMGYHAGIAEQVQHLTGISRSSSGKALRVIATAGGNANLWFYQAIELDPRLLGQYVTFTGLVRSNTNNARIYISLNSINAMGPSHSGSGDWELLSQTVFVPTTTTTLFVGCVIGNSTDGGSIAITSGWYVDLTNAITTIGQEPREFMPFGGNRITELMGCKRYYEKSHALTEYPGAAISNGVHVTCNTSSLASSGVLTTYIPYSVMKYAAPVVTVYDVAGTVAQWTYYNTSGAGVNVACATYDSNATGFNLRTSTAVATYVLARGHWTAQAEF